MRDALKKVWGDAVKESVEPKKETLEEKTLEDSPNPANHWHMCAKNVVHETPLQLGSSFGKDAGYPAKGKFSDYLVTGACNRIAIRHCQPDIQQPKICRISAIPQPCPRARR